MSYVYRQQSSLATVKLNGSIGFHASALLRVCERNPGLGHQLEKIQHIKHHPFGLEHQVGAMSVQQIDI